MVRTLVRRLSPLLHGTSPAASVLAQTRRLQHSQPRQDYGVVLEAAREHWSRVALVDSHGRHTYGELYRRGARVASQLRQAVPDRSTRVSFLASNNHQYLAMQWGIWMTGNVAVPLCKAHPATQLRYFIEDSQSDVVLSSPELADSLQQTAEHTRSQLIVVDSDVQLTASETPPENVEQQSPEFYRTAPAMLLYTSGTTGPPKGVVLSHGNLMAQVRAQVAAWEWSCADVVLHTLPLHHTHGVVNLLLCPLSVGARCVMLPEFDAAKVWWELLDTVPEPEERVNMFMAVPTIYVKLLQEYRLKSRNNFAYQAFVKDVCMSKIRLMVSGSAALPRPVLDEWESVTGHRLLERYGMTEIGMALTNPLHGNRIPGAVGNPFPSVEVRLAQFDPRVKARSGEEYTVLAEGTSHATKVTSQSPNPEGELLVRGPSVFSEYWRRPEATSKEFTSDGWFRTGDTAQYSSIDGVFRILGRTSVDIIKSGGFKISALDVERHLLEHPDIVDVAVVGAPDITWGQKVAAVAVTSSELSLPALKAWCKERMPPYAAPTVLRIVPELPRNNMGKVNKKELLKTMFPSDGRGL